MRQKLVSAACCAIRMRSKETDAKKAVELLNKDLLNGPLHCFGVHSHCSTDFCSVAQDHQAASSGSSDQAASSSTINIECENSADESDNDIEGNII